MTMKSTVPLFDFGDTFPTTVKVGDVDLPLNIKRFSKPELDAFEKQWSELIEPRGEASTPLSDDATKAREAAQLDFYESSIRDYITVDEGLLVSRGKPVTDGEGLIDMFYARKEILSSFLVAIFVENRLSGALRKNSNSPRGSDRGSEQSIPTRGGDVQGSTAGSAAPSSTAVLEDATDANSQVAAQMPLVSSGTASAATAVA